MRVAVLAVAVTMVGAASPVAFSHPMVQQPAPASGPAYDALQAGIGRIAAADPVTAQGHFQRALDLARAEGNRLVEGAAHRGLGTAFLHQGRYQLAKPEFEAAVHKFLELDSKPNVALSYIDLGNSDYHLGDHAAARDSYLKALEIFRTLGGTLSRQASIHYNLSLVAVSQSESLLWVTEGLQLARKGEDLENEGSLLHSWSDLLFNEGKLAEAKEKVDQAIDLLRRVNSPSHLSRALTSLGRLYRAHGQHSMSLESYRSALEIQERIGDRGGMIQSLNAMGIASFNLDRTREARTFHERAAELARKVGSPSARALAVGNLARLLIITGEASAGVEMLEQLLEDSPLPHYLYSHLAQGLVMMKQYERAVDMAGRSIEIARHYSSVELLENSLRTRAEALDELGRTGEAIADLTEAITLIETGRADAVRTDAMKSGYAGQKESAFSQGIALLQKLGRHREALDLAEKARGRAFADLLASREAWSLPSEGDSGRRADLESARSIPALSSTELAAVASRLGSTIVSYWVDASVTYIWTVSGSGAIQSVSVPVSESALTDLVGRARAIGRHRRASPNRGESEIGLEGSLNQGDWMARVRGEGLLSLGSDAVSALRSLDALLIEPVRRWLPERPGSLLTIIPHGPLFQLSFAALQDRTGRYLVERHAVHYAPAGVVLQLTGSRTKPAAAADQDYLFVGDPVSLPQQPGGRPLPRLPGTRSEISQVAALMPRDGVTTLLGSRATEPEVRRLAPQRTILHFATHGVVRSDDPLESFLALDTGTGAHGPGETKSLSRGQLAQDGRLTVREIYDLRLDAELVVLSACGTGLGKVSGDGVAGLARAFVYAGAPSVLATLWDLADEPAARLMPQFYRSLHRRPDKAQALRDAQLKFLRDLRSHDVKVATPSGTVTLSEHPVLWAGFVLVGER